MSIRANTVTERINSVWFHQVENVADASLIQRDGATLNTVIVNLRGHESPWAFSTSSNTLASVLLTPPPRCTRPLTAERRWRCHLHVVSCFSRVAQRCSPPALSLMPLSDSRPRRSVRDDRDYVAGRNGKPGVEAGWDSPQGNLWVSSAPLCERDPVQKGRFPLFALLNNLNSSLG